MKTYLLIAILSLLTLSGCSTTPRDPAKPTGRIIGEVVQVVKAPDRCEEKDNSFVRGLVGAGLGIAAGNQIGDGSGKNWAKAIGAVAGYGLGKSVNSEDDDLTVCKDRGYLVTIIYKDNFNQNRYHEKRFKQPRRVGELIDFKL
tara:strand:+ start:21711 stop:22142 length:432 start_codon:yes stop_codon:yes gene_type:complete